MAAAEEKRRSMKRRLASEALLFLLFVLFCVSAGCGKQNGAEGARVTLEIRCDTVWKNWDLVDPELKEPGVVPRDGTVLAKTSIVFSEGDTVFSVLRRMVAELGIALRYTGEPDKRNVYIDRIGTLGEFDCGASSGWLYSVNGSFPSVSCSVYTLTTGDAIRFLYTCDGGTDVGNRPVA